MFNIILFISTYPVLLIIYFVLKNNNKFHDHLLFSRIHEGRMGRATCGSEDHKRVS